MVEDRGEVSDGYHTFNELYAHRCALFALLMRSNPRIAWRARKHADGSVWDGWFIAGMRLSTGDVTYHLPEADWCLLDGAEIETLDVAPEWDGHTSGDVVARLRDECHLGAAPC